MREIIGNTITTPMAIPDWNQTDETKADYIKNKPVLGALAGKDKVGPEDLTADIIAGVIEETDPTVPAWAKEATKPSYSLSELTEDATHRTVTDTDKSNWNAKVDKIDGKGLSTNDYTDEEKQNLAGLSALIAPGSQSPSIEMFDGDASAKYAIAAGTNDKTPIKGIVGETAAALISVSTPKAQGVGSIAFGGGAEAKTSGGQAIGPLNTTGVKGYYYSAIDFTNNTITLSTEQDTAKWPSGTTLDWQAKKEGTNIFGQIIGAYEGDTISIVNNSKYPACAKITKISGNVITVDNLPFTQIESSGLTTPDDKSIFACYKKTEVTAVNERWYPRSGVVELGWAGTAFGVENLVTGSGGFVGGWNNWQAGDFGATFGRDNIGGYAGLTVGSGNTSNSDSALVTGHGNEVKGSTNALVSGGSNIVAAGQSMVGGYNNSVTAGSAGAIVAGDSNVLTGGYCTFVTGKDNNVSGAQSIVGGQYVKNTGGRNLILGDRVADTVAAGATQTYTITEVAGNNNIVGGTGNKVSSNHSAAFGTRNSLTGNKGQIAAGSNNVLTNWNNAAFGRHLNVTTSAMAAVGQFNKTTTDRAMFVVGNGNANTSGAGNTSGKANEVCDDGTTYSIVRDNAFVVYYNGSYVGGYGHTLSDGKCNAISGRDHTISGSNSLVSGRQNTVPSSQCIVAGQSNKVQSGNSGAAGYLNTINSSCSGGFVIGTNNIIAKGNQLACGMCNSPSNSAFLIVGNGSYKTASQYNELSDTEKTKYTSETAPDGSTIYVIRQNAFAVNSNGTATVGNNPVNPLDVATKQYVDENAGSNVDFGDVEIGRLSVGRREDDGLDTESTKESDRYANTKNTVASWSLGVGRKLTLNNSQSLSVGYNNTNSSSCTITVGEGLTTTQYCGAAFGKHNKTTNSLLVVGKGSSSSPSDAFIVQTDGRATVGKDPVNALDVATKQYVDSHSGGLNVNSFDTTYFKETADGKITIDLSGLLDKEW
jgi:hypothetical protein